MLYDKHRNTRLENVHKDVSTEDVANFCKEFGFAFYALGSREDRDDTETFQVTTHEYPATSATVLFSKVLEWKAALVAIGEQVVEGGTYRHYKGGIYETVLEATDEATGEPVIVYRSQDGRTWTRARNVFFGVAHDNGKIVARFAYAPNLKAHRDAA